ncbi:MAG: nucleotide exchange factor GrpE [Gammaproteobacteria bacterium]
MTTEAQKIDLLEDFRNYLQQSKLESPLLGEQPDLSTLLAEMAGLKAEVKAESRQFKNTLDTLNSALDAVQEDKKTLATELAAQAERLEQQQRDAMRGLLLEIVDIYDRLTTGLDVLQNYRPAASLFKHSKKQDIRFIKDLQEGQAMTTRRFEQLLLRYQVRAIACIGNPLDPVTMSAVETTHDPSLANGIVVEELRKGFLFHDQVLRLAEVKVNKSNTR